MSEESKKLTGETFKVLDKFSEDSDSNEPATNVPASTSPHPTQEGGGLQSFHLAVLKSTLIAHRCTAANSKSEEFRIRIVFLFLQVSVNVPDVCNFAESPNSGYSSTKSQQKFVCIEWKSI